MVPVEIDSIRRHRTIEFFPAFALYRLNQIFAIMLAATRKSIKQFRPVVFNYQHLILTYNQGFGGYTYAGHAELWVKGIPQRLNADFNRIPGVKTNAPYQARFSIIRPETFSSAFENSRILLEGISSTTSPVI